MKKLVNGIEVELTTEEHIATVEEWEKNKAEYFAIKYKLDRKKSYPEIGEQLDAIWKFIATLDPLDENTKIMYNKIVDIKQKFPKPEQK